MRGSDVGSRSQHVSFCVPGLLLPGTSLEERGRYTGKPSQIKLKLQAVKIDGVVYVRCVPFTLCCASIIYTHIYIIYVCVCDRKTEQHPHALGSGGAWVEHH